MNHVHGNRQIHLDFHTAGNVPDVGCDFDATQFANTMRDAHVSSVNVFAKCHHGYSYYPTDVGVSHPGLKRDLLGEQISALHSVGIHAPIYVSVLWDDLAGEMHPEWMVTTREGRTLMRTPLSHDSPLNNEPGWTTLDVGGGYGDYVLAQVRELCERYPVDGFWFDIVWAEPNYAPHVQAQMRAAGVDLGSEASVREYAESIVTGWREKAFALIRSFAPTASVFFNGTVDARAERTLRHQTHFEIESLPTSEGLWGYMHYPVIARYVRTIGAPFVGMTGRFHKSWADFGGLKPPAQLDFECGTILGAGGAISIGDQLDPRGRLDSAVYRTVGSAFEKVEALEEWLSGAIPVADIAILADLELAVEGMHTSHTFTDEVQGAAQMLLDMHIQFDVVNPEFADLLRYAAVIVPSGTAVSDELAAKLDQARRAGVKLVVSGTAGLEGSSFAIHDVPVEYLGLAPTNPTYLIPGEAASSDDRVGADFPYVFYDPTHLVRAKPGAVTFGSLAAARYSRTWEHFSSHAHAPVGQPLDHPLAVADDGILYLAAPLFGGYRHDDYWIYRALIENLLSRFVPPYSLSSNAPAWVELGLFDQTFGTSGLRKVIHANPYTPRRSFSAVPRVDESATLGPISVRMSASMAPQRVYLAPGRTPIDFSFDDDRGLLFTVDGIRGHTVIVAEWDNEPSPQPTTK